MTDIAARNLQWAWTLIDTFAAAGVREAVISPGSRSTPLVLACERHPAVRTWIQVDERCAGFFALGLARVERRPAILICTSGTAPAHWYPAVIEASESAVPLLLLSADRPPELHDCGANQTINQRRLFGVHVRDFHDLPPADSADPAIARQLATQAWSECTGLRAGPVHLNVPFREPLVPSSLQTPQPSASHLPVSRTRQKPRPEQISDLTHAMNGRRGLIVCGWDSGEEGFAGAVSGLAEQLRCPLLADPLSGVRFGNHSRNAAISRYDAFLRNKGFVARHQPEWVLRFGAMPVSKALGNYLQGCEATDFVLIDVTGRRLDPLRRATALVTCDAVPLCEAVAAANPEPAQEGWLEGFIEAEQRSALAAHKPPEARIVRELVDQLPPGSLLFSGNSTAIREIDSWSGTAAKPLRIIANRGVSGIDGNVSTLAGLAAAHAQRSVGLIGDLALYHDMNGLLAARELDLILVVLNNGGGGIFGYLPQAGLAGFERNWLTPTGLDLEQVAQLYAVSYRRVDDAEEFAPALAAALEHHGPQLIEVMIDRAASLEAHRRYWAAAAR
ncbi:2-succinyl-5-enolpyruvyl-6-hydroxy-3-cyclohexene-1-carboxylic-acid synthase [Thiohalomonas denitrificans]|uniref:2-succinyl-5-enolpyruvyl-6-hydroxy-3- cyclohexene-1-carboxylic-acid synthase n=1 Tax=Thiohalomonas denitrificans TaxID=415747 RepID=UPI0026E9EB41|nr:2-succinyl-5-enolpyruvyl-6-hydroxy-3-cyclohexene-1-carboxylic-acid synthase [Thiohalomonas denitrificans]